MHEAADSFRHLGTTERRLWPFNHYLSTFFRSRHCLSSDLSRKSLIPELAGVRLQGALILHTKGFGRLVDGSKHWGKETPQDMAVWQGNQLRGLLMGSTMTCLLGIFSWPPELTGSAWML